MAAASPVIDTVAGSVVIKMAPSSTLIIQLSLGDKATKLVIQAPQAGDGGDLPIRTPVETEPISPSTTATPTDAEDVVMSSQASEHELEVVEPPRLRNPKLVRRVKNPEALPKLPLCSVYDTDLEFVCPRNPNLVRRVKRD